MEGRCVCCGEIVPEGRMVCAACEMNPGHAVREKQNLNGYEFSIVPKNQHDLFFSGSHDKERGCIGHLRGDFGRDGNEFWTSWWPHCISLKTENFSRELDDFVNSLRERGPLKNRAAMAAFCAQHPEAEINSWSGRTYGFSYKTNHYAFYLRCFPGKGDYNFYMYCYDTSRLSSELGKEC